MIGNRHINIMKTNNKISQQTYPDHDTLPPLLENLRKEKQGQQVPEGYFDTLSPRIVDRIGNRNRQNRLFIILTTIRKKFVWAPVMATSVIAVLLIFVIPGPKQLPVAPSDELSQILMAYDPSYAEESMLTESEMIDNEIDKSDTFSSGSENSFDSSDTGPTDDEIAEYLKNQEIETEMLTEY